MNPVIWREGVCDPHVKVFGGKVYLYATHDTPGYESFHMADWQIWSSEDLIDWKLERVIDPAELHCGKIDQCWAVDAAWRDGKYYYYFSTGDWGVGVAVGDSPAGPFRDALGKALVDYDTEPLHVQKWDPCVFIDDDGEAYLIVGSCATAPPDNHYLIARLNSDMISLAEPLRPIEYRGNPCPEDKASIHRHNGRYYLTHSSFYAVSDNVYGPYDYLGNTDANIDHGSYFTWRGQTYFASGGMDNPNRYLRASFLTCCHYRENGEIVVDQKVMGYGAGQYDACWDKIEAEWFTECSDMAKTGLPGGGFVMEPLRDGAYLLYPNMANLEDNPSVAFFAACDGSQGALIEVHGENGSLLGVCEIPATGGLDQFQLFRCPLTVRQGHQSLRLVLRTSSPNSLRLDWLSFAGETYRFCAESCQGAAGRGAAVVSDSGASCRRALRNLHLKGASVTLPMDGGPGGPALLRVRYAAANGGGALRLTINEEDAGTLAFPADKTEACTEVSLCEGVNVVTLRSEQYQAGRITLDNLILERPRDCFRTYAAADGELFPKGNGCWEGLPQRECDPRAFSGRLVKYLEKDGDAVSITVDGGEGGPVRLMIRRTGEGELSLLVNGEPCGPLSTAVLRPGANTITLRKKGSGGSVAVDAVSVLPDQ